MRCILLSSSSVGVPEEVLGGDQSAPAPIAGEGEDGGPVPGGGGAVEDVARRNECRYESS